MPETFSYSPNISDKPIEKRIGKNVLPDAPQVSVIVPAYNVAEYIAESLDSALAQTFKNYEIIVVNDGSPDTDNLETVLQPFYDEIIYLKQPNGGAAAARNAGIAAARGSLLAFLDGDDVWYAEKLASQTAFLAESDYEMIYCDALLFGEPLYNGKTFMQTAPSDGKVTPESLLEGHCNVLTSANIVAKNAVVKYGLFDPKAFRVEDFELWFRLCKKGVKIGYQKDVLLKYRIRAGSLTGSNVAKAERSIAALETVKDRNKLTESELKAWRRQMRAAKAELDLERGKNNLASGNFAEARVNFAAANQHYRKLKLKALMWSLKISPHLVLNLFKKLRPVEFSYITTNNSQK